MLFSPEYFILVQLYAQCTRRFITFEVVDEILSLGVSIQLKAHECFIVVSTVVLYCITRWFIFISEGTLLNIFWPFLKGSFLVFFLYLLWYSSKLLKLYLIVAFEERERILISFRSL